MTAEDVKCYDVKLSINLPLFGINLCKLVKVRNVKWNAEYN